MPSQIVLLRGINLGANNRVAMPALREALTAHGFEHVRTYVQSGNVVMSTDLGEAALTAEVTELLRTQFGLDVPVVTRTRQELAQVVRRNPLKEVATNPKRYQVSFLSAEPPAEVIDRLHELTSAAAGERLAAAGREIYAWHPGGVARSKLWSALAARGGLGGVVATARNWTTVTTLLEMASSAQDDRAA